LTLACVTGASSGIGAEYARALAERGYNLIITARRAEKLQALADELQQAHGVSVRVITADLTHEADLLRLVEVIEQETELDLLINNAGFGTTGDYATVEIDRQIDMVRVHIEAPMRLCRATLPNMIQRGKGYIINVSSIAAFLTTGSPTYTATKAFLNNFSLSLQSEVKKTGIRIQALCPGYTYSEFHDTDEFSSFSRSQIPRWLWMTSEAVVKQSLEKLDRRRVILIPGFQNRLLVVLMRTGFLPLISWLRNRLVRER